MSNPEAPEATPKPALVAIFAVSVIAVLTLGGIYLLIGPLPDGAARPALTDVLAIIGAVVAPIVSIAAAYYGISIALKTNAEAQRLIRDATRASIETAEGFTGAVTNITLDLHNQNLQLIEALQRGGSFEAHPQTGPHAYEATHPTVPAPAPRTAREHANAPRAGETEVVQAETID